ncbi:MAG: AtpZ/AtpI family protein [Deltaproteobacteria bacterium]|nr:AtpZ/AtpI family protein [Deltaproteobacteria bacterium]
MLMKPKKHQQWSEGLTITMQLGLTMAGCVLFCFWIGYLLDKWLGTRGIFITVFILLGIAGGGVTVYRQIMGVMAPPKNGSGSGNGDLTA